MTTFEPLQPARSAVFFGEVRKLSAFLRRDFLVAWSYRMNFVTDWVGLLVQAILFSFVGKIIDQSKMPSYNGTQASYIEFVAIGISLSVFVQIGLRSVSAGLRSEQLMGTLESLLMTPTSTTTVQLGAVMYQLVYVPIRTALFLVLIALVFGANFAASGLLPSAMLLVAFIPFIWGIGVASAAAVLTFRQGAGAFAFGVGLLTLASGAYFPLSVMPPWLETLAKLNPMAIAINGMREALIGGSGAVGVGSALAVLVPASAVALGFGVFVFRRAVRRELRRGSLGLY
jgi:ABC-2 type transport system permease protein